MAFTSTPVRGGRCLASPPISPVSLLSSTSPSPTRLSRLQEKEELRHLNDRLAAYIERVRVLEAEKSALHQSLSEQEEKTDRQLDTLRLCYERELADARRTLDDVAIQRATLQVELGKIGEEHRELRSRSSKIEADLNLAQAHVKDLSAQLSEKEADLAAVLVEKRSLMNDLHELKDEAVSLKQSLEDTKEQLHNEVLRGVDLENHRKTLLEQMALKKCLHEDELKETRRVYENRIAEIESIYQTKVSDALQGLRQQQEEQIEGYKLEMERTFHAKMVNAQLSSAKHSDIAKAVQEELKQAQQRAESLASQLNQCESQNIAFETKIRELQEMIDYDRDLHRRRMAEKEQEMARVHQQTQAQLEEYENLLDVKLALDLEIDTYRTMLEGEEQRLRLSPSSSSHSTATRATSQGQQFLPGKKRKMKEAKKRRLSVGFKTVQHAAASGKVSIEEIDADGKFVRLKNKSDEDQPLHGWVLRRHLGGVSDATYTFPSQFTLQAGQVVTIWGAAAGVSPGPSDLVWKSQRSWGAADTIDVTLIKDDGQELAKRKIMHVPTGEESGEQDDDYEEITESEMEFLSQQNEDPSCSIL